MIFLFLRSRCLLLSTQGGLFTMCALKAVQHLRFPPGHYCLHPTRQKPAADHLALPYPVRIDADQPTKPGYTQFGNRHANQTPPTPHTTGNQNANDDYLFSACTSST